MAGRRARLSDEPTVVETDRFRFTVAGDYVLYAAADAPVFDSHGTLLGETDGRTPLTEQEWAPSMRFMPEWVEFTAFGHDQPDFHCRVELRDDVPRVVAFGWRANEGQVEIRQSTVRAIKVSTAVDTVYAPWVGEVRDVWRDKDGQSLRAELGEEQHRVIRGLLDELRNGRRHVTAAFLRQVAEVYRANFDTAPAEAVARTFGVKQRMAHAYVRRARDRGFLPPTTQGKKAK